MKKFKKIFVLLIYNLLIMNSILAVASVPSLNKVELKSQFWFQEKYGGVIQLICTLLAISIVIFTILKMWKRFKLKKSIFDTIVFFLGMLGVAYIIWGIGIALNMQWGPPLGEL